MGQLSLPTPVIIAGGNLPQVRIKAPPPPTAPPFAASKPGPFGAGSTLQTHNATKRRMIAEVLGLIWRAAGDIPRMATIVRCNCGAEYKRTETKFLVPQRVTRSARSAGLR